jgi:hypothetical protein
MPAQTDWIAPMIEGISGGIKGIMGIRQAREANRDKKDLWNNYPYFQIPQEYKSALATYQGLSGGNMSGYNLASGNIDQSTGQAMGSAKEGAMSSTQYLDSVAKLNQASLDAKMKLDIASAQWRTEMAKGFAEASGKMGDIKTQQWAQNVNRPWNLQMNEALSKYQEGMGNAWGGLDTLVQSGYNLSDTGIMGGGNKQTT